jgi:CBS domain-containing protein
MVTIKHLLEDKGWELWVISPDATVYDAVALMAERGVGALPVLDGTRLVGIVTERDYARKVVLQDRSSRTTKVATIMTRAVVCATLDQSVQECMALMTERRFRHLPVLDGGRMVGMISVGDLVKAVLSEKQAEIDQLSSYIHGEVAGRPH